MITKPKENTEPLGTTSPLFGESLRSGLVALLRASLFAVDAGVDCWRFALEIDQLYGAGTTITDLRWLVATGLAEHGEETTSDGSEHRTFRRSECLKFSRTTCLVLTPEGARYAARMLDEQSASSGTSDTRVINFLRHAQLAPLADVSHVRPGIVAPILKPRWDSHRRELAYADQVVKRFRVPAPNQEIILTAFQEEDWPECVHDPLPIDADIDPKTRLHDAIGRLNGKQQHPLLRFRGNGNGEGICWEVRLPPQQAEGRSLC